MKIDSLINALPTIPIMVQVGINAFGTLQLRAAGNRISWTIGSRSDLNIVRSAIQTNLLLGIPILANSIVLAGALFWAATVSSALMIFYIAILAVVQALAWKICRPVEQRFKALPVQNQDPNISLEYRDYVKQWTGLRLLLSQPKEAERQRTDTHQQS